MESNKDSFFENSDFNFDEEYSMKISRISISEKLQM